MNIIKISDFFKPKLIKEKTIIEDRLSFYQCKFGGGIPDFIKFNGFIDSFAIFETKDHGEILVKIKNLKRFLDSQERLNQNIKPIDKAISEVNKLNNLK